MANELSDLVRDIDRRCEEVSRGWISSVTLKEAEILSNAVKRQIVALRSVEMILQRIRHRLDLVTENERRVILNPLLDYDGREFNRFYQVGIGENLSNKRRPTVQELDAILNSDDNSPVIINPDGTITNTNKEG